MIKETSKVAVRPQMPCEICGFWSTTCDQSKCRYFQKYKEEMKKFEGCR